MKISRLIGLLAASGGLAALSMAAAPAYKDGELLLRIKPNMMGQVSIGLSAMGATELERYPQIGYVRVRYASNRTMAQAILAAKKLPFVAGVEKNATRKYFAMPNDPMANQQWHLNKVMLPGAWDNTTGSTNVKIAIIDSGVQMNHPDLMANLDPGWDTVDNDNDPTDSDNVGHGTHVAGIAAASTNNGIGIAGAGYDCRIIPVRAGGTFLFTSDVIEAIIWATDNDADVINMSLGGFASTPAEQSACTYAINNGVLVVAAAGNHGGTQKSYPAAYPGVMAVANSTTDDSRNPGSAFGNWVHVAAPGTNILSTMLNSTYEENTGTSMASPLVAGIAALVDAKSNETMSVTQLFDAITNSCDPVPGNYTIFGRVNALQAVQAATIIITEELNAVAVETFAGSLSSGDLTSLEDNDGNSLVLSSENIHRFGTAAGFEVDFDVIGNPNIYFNWKLQVRSRTTAPATGMLWLKRVSNGQWVHIRSFPLTGTESNQSVKLATNMAPYIALDGKIEMRMRVHIPHRVNRAAQAFNAEIDQVVMTAEYEEQL
jgi:thermitase